MNPTPTYKPALACRILGHKWWMRKEDAIKITQVHCSHCQRCGIPNPTTGIGEYRVKSIPRP